MSEQKKVLVIEDDVETAKYHAQRLYLFGFDCDLAYDGRTALDMLRTKEYELALVDIRLPDINGLELLNIIRSERIRIFAIAVSGFGEPSDRIQGLDAGADDYMVKPADYQELLSRYNALLRRDPQKTLFYQIRDIQAFAADEQARINCKLDAIFACVSTSQKTMTALRAASDVLKASLADGIRRIVKSINARNIDGLDISGPRTMECKEQVLAVVSWLANPRHLQNIHHACDTTFRFVANGYSSAHALFLWCQRNESRLWALVESYRLNHDVA